MGWILEWSAPASVAEASVATLASATAAVARSAAEVSAADLIHVVLPRFGPHPPCSLHLLNGFKSS